MRTVVKPQITLQYSISLRIFVAISETNNADISNRNNALTNV